MMAESQVPSNDPERSLGEISILVEVPPKMMTEIEHECHWLEYSPGDVIIDTTDTTTDVYFLVKGRLRVMNILADTQEVALAELQSGDCFGELSAIDSKNRSARVTAMERSIVASLPSKEFRRLLVVCPEMALALLKSLTSLIRTLSARVTSLSLMSPHQRVYYELLRISEPNTQGDGSWIIRNIPNHAEIAAWVGAEREVVADAIGRLARERVVERKHKNLLIKDRDRLQRLTEQ